MRSAHRHVLLLTTVGLLSGCAQVGQRLATRDSDRPAAPAQAVTADVRAESPFVARIEAGTAVDETTASESAATQGKADAAALRPRLSVRPVSHNCIESSSGGSIHINGRTYRIELISEAASALPDVAPLTAIHFASQSSPVNGNQAMILEDQASPLLEADSASEVPSDTTILNLPSALAMVGGDHPAVGMAQWKVQEAYADLEEAESLWLPSIRTGISFHRHDGNYQASNGAIVDVNRSSLQYGLGAGATGAGTTPQQGLQVQFHLADAIFEPEIARKTAWATGHAEKAVVNRQLRDVAIAYFELLRAHQELRILQDVREKTAGLATITRDFAAAGEGLQADADRARTDLILIDGRIAQARENADVSSAGLAQAVSSEPGLTIIPGDVTLVPLQLTSGEARTTQLIRSGLATRPELKELQALVAAACDRHQREKYSPFVPSVLLGLSAGGFGGDTGTSFSSVNDRYDFDAVVTWELRNLGFGERAARRRTEAQVQHAMYQKVKRIDDVAREISEAHTQVVHRRERMTVTQSAIQTARDSYNRNLSRIRDGEGLPIEVMLSVQALESAQRAYMNAVVEYNQAQFQLKWAMGW